VKSGITNENAVEVDELARSLGNKGNFADLNKKINAAKAKSKVLDKPLEKPAAERVSITFISLRQYFNYFIINIRLIPPNLP
jgi:hypothetical protein